MPYKKKIVRKAKSKKGYKKRIPRGPRWKNTVNMGLGFPKKCIATLKYNTTYVLASTTGSLSHYQFRMNGIYDPDVTSVGNQPTYFDQYMAIYNHWVVLGSKLDLKICAYDGNACPVDVAIWMNDDSIVTPTTVEALMNYPSSKRCLLGNGGNSATTCTLKYSAKKMFGGNVLANSNLRGGVSSDPAEQSVAVISIQSGDKTSTTNTVILAQMEYIVCFLEPKDINIS